MYVQSDKSDKRCLQYELEQLYYGKKGCENHFNVSDFSPRTPRAHHKPRVRFCVVALKLCKKSFLLQYNRSFNHEVHIKLSEYTKSKAITSPSITHYKEECDEKGSLTYPSYRVWTLEVDVTDV